MKESGFAQHCFFKSLQLQRSAIVYTNLGFLYYRYDNVELANQAFSKAQQTDPMYSLAWIGQVFYYFFVFKFKLKRKLFRHLLQKKLIIMNQLISIVIVLIFLIMYAQQQHNKRKTDFNCIQIFLF